MKRPMVICAAILLVLSFFLYAMDIKLIYILGMTFFILAVLFIVIKQLREFAVICIVLVLFFLSTIRISQNYLMPNDGLQNEELVVSGTVCEVARRDIYNTVILRVADGDNVIRTDSKIKLTTYRDNMYVGDEIRAKVVISGFKDEYKPSYFSRGVFATGYIKNTEEIKYGNNLMHLKSKITRAISNIFFTEMEYDEASLCCAMAVGNREYESEEFGVAARRSGVTHIMVVSGMHMIVICGSIKKLLEALRCNRQIANAVTVLFVIIFTCLCGFSGSVLRSALMYGVYLLGDFMYKGHDGLNSLCVAAVLMFIFNPFVARDIGFLLSVASTAGIIVIMPIFEVHINKFIKNKFINSFLMATCVTVSAMITTLPITVCYYSEVSLTALPTNLLVSAASSIMMILCVTGILISLVPIISFFGRVILLLSSVIGKYIIAIIEWLGNMRYSAINCGIGIILLVYILVIAILLALKYTYIRNKRCKTHGDSLRADAEKQHKQR